MRWRILRRAVAALVSFSLLAIGGHASLPQLPLLTDEMATDFFTKVEFAGETRIIREDVEATFGLPGDYRSGPTRRVVFLLGPSADTWELEEPLYVLTWHADTVTLEIGFDSSGKVVMVHPISTERIEQTPFDNLLWRIKRQWFLDN